jgi:hypothetical protein
MLRGERAGSFRFMRTDYSADAFFLGFSFIYASDTLVRLIGLGWKSFRSSGWNVFDMFVSVGSLATTAIAQAQDEVGTVMQQLQKLFMVTIAFKLIQRVDSLNKLFKLVVYVFIHPAFCTNLNTRGAAQVCPSF